MGSCPATDIDPMTDDVILWMTKVHSDKKTELRVLPKEAELTIFRLLLQMLYH